MQNTGTHSEELKEQLNDLTHWAYHWGSGKAFKLCSLILQYSLCHLGLVFQALQLFESYKPLHTDIHPKDVPEKFSGFRFNCQTYLDDP